MKKELAALQSSRAVILVADVHAVSAGFLTYIYRGFPLVVILVAAGVVVGVVVVVVVVVGVVAVVGVVGVVDSAANVSGN